MATKLVQAAALAAALVPLGAVPAEASSIATTSCGYGAEGFFACASTPSGSGVGGQSSSQFALFFWENYSVSLFFENVHGEFNIAVTNEEITQAQFNARLPTQFANHVCVPIDDGLPNGPCVVFQFTGDGTESRAPGTNGPSDPGTWTGSWYAAVNWAANTNAGYPGDTVRLLHARGVGGDLIFDDDITLPGSYCPFECDPFNPGFFDFIFSEDTAGFDTMGFSLYPGSDPEISGTAESFSYIGVSAVQAVPEPGTFVLLGSGALVLWFRNRRRKGLNAGAALKD